MSRQTYAIALFFTFVATIPSPFAFLVVGGAEPVWVYFAYAQVDYWIWWVVALFWTAVYLIVAWWVADPIFLLLTSRSPVALASPPLLLALMSLLPIYIPMSHGGTESVNIIEEYHRVTLKFRQFQTLRELQR
ncbi:MAG: hypothetical protein DMF98_16500 [Acidobacteria bacterium]|nr:MAG: hypothetical protein DMF98_16500 [Acidobacteriota bacterium]TMH19284.1 MAG: hypothetical protein E6H70_03950 [Betaproteobacteria bacterium]